MIFILSVPLVNIISEVGEAISENIPTLSDKETGEDNESKGEQIMATYYVESVESTVKDLISERFSLDSADFKVSAMLGEDYGVKNVTIYLYTDADVGKIKDFTQNILCIKTEIRSMQNNEK